jgi:hypothetical protein
MRFFDKFLGIGHFLNKALELIKCIWHVNAVTDITIPFSWEQWEIGINDITR